MDRISVGRKPGGVYGLCSLPHPVLSETVGRKSIHRFVFGESTVVFLAYFMRKIVSPVAGIGMIILLLTAGCSESTDYAQPIAYNHATHIQEVGMECIDCHIQAETHQKASIPNIALCIECHEEALAESKEEEKLIQAYQQTSHNKENLPM